MRNAAVVLIVGCVALAGCDRLGFGAKEPVAADGSAEAGAGNDARAEAPASPSGISDAGITRSRSLAGLTGGGGVGDKEPGAIPASAPGSIQPGLLVGRWSDDGNCKQDFEFLADGTFRTYEGVEGGWSLNGDTLTLIGAADPLQITLRAVDADRLVVLNADGSFDQATRC